ncbi:MAG: hypothetical protein IPH09_16305 [bacterium]|nr:hypothetical protein [bacterium]
MRPNPFNPQTSIAFTLPSDGPGPVAVYDLQGRLVRSLHEGDLAAGPTRWPGTAATTEGAPRPAASTWCERRLPGS